jgi:hypothetical protein
MRQLTAALRVTLLKEEAPGRVAMPRGSSESRSRLFVTRLRRNAE